MITITRKYGTHRTHKTPDGKRAINFNVLITTVWLLGIIPIFIYRDGAYRQ